MSEATFDYIIVGAGSAGCVLADRLSADGRHRVLILEAGGRDWNPWIHIPVGYAKLFFDQRVNWGYWTEPEDAAGGRRIYWPRGKVLGGSSSVNGLIYIRGNSADYDQWRQAGCAGWGYDDVLPYFKRSEDQVRGADEHHGAGGPLAVSDLSEAHPLCEAFIAAAEQTGIPRNADFNGARQEGAGYYQLTTRNGLRCSAAKAFLRPARRRANLTIQPNAHVLRVAFDGRTATGVDCHVGGERRRFIARREVILSAGAINSPQLLELSGIGSADRLSGLDIDIVADAPGVGENLQDHYQVRHILKATRPITLNDRMSTLSGRLRIGLDYALRRRGPMTVSAGQVGVFAKTAAHLDMPDVQIHFLTLSTDLPGKSLHPFSGFTSSVCQLRPQSRGHVHISEPDPRQPPKIAARYLTDPADCATMVAAMRLNRRILNAPALAHLLAEEVRPAPDRTSDDDLLAYARETGSSIFHPVGTCRMGDDPGSVVDPRLRVRGVSGLRVVDASIMPTLISGNTNAPAIMIGEKGADMILGDARA